MKKKFRVSRKAGTPKAVIKGYNTILEGSFEPETRRIYRHRGGKVLTMKINTYKKRGKKLKYAQMSIMYGAGDKMVKKCSGFSLRRIRVIRKALFGSPIRNKPPTFSAIEKEALIAASQKMSESIIATAPMIWRATNSGEIH